MKKLIALLLTLALALSLAACGGSSGAQSGIGGGGTPAVGDSAAVPNEETIANTANASSGWPGQIPEFDENAVSSKDTLVVRMDIDNASLDNVNGSNTYASSVVFNAVGSCLLAEGVDENGNDNFIIQKHSLADSMVWDDDMMGVTFHIKSNATFHSGSKVTAEDVVFSLQRYSENARYDYIDFPNITAVDEETVYIPLNYKSGEIYSTIGRNGRIMEKALYEKAVAAGKEADFFYESDGLSGPYEITEWVSGDHVTLTAYDGYFGGAAKIKTVLIRFIPDNTVAGMELEAGTVDIVYSPDFSDVSRALNGEYGDQINIYQDCSDMLCYLGINFAGPMADDNLRSAVLHGIDWQQVYDVAFAGKYAKPSTFYAGTFLFLKDTSEWWDSYYDPDLAKEYLANSDYPGGTKLTIIHNNLEEYVACCEILKNQLANLGIELDIVGYDSSTWAATMQGTEGWDLYLRTWGGNGYCVTPVKTLASVTAHVDVTKPEMYDAIVAASDEFTAALDQNEAAKLFADIQDKTTSGEYLYMFPVAQELAQILYSSQLKGFSRIGPAFYFSDAYFE